MKSISVGNRISVLATAGLLLLGSAVTVPLAFVAPAQAITVTQTEKYGEEAQLVQVREATITLDASWDVTWDDANDTTVNFTSPDGSVQGFLVAGTADSYRSDDADKLLLSNFERSNGALSARYGISNVETTEYWRDNGAFFAVGEGSNTTLDGVSVLAIQGDQIATLVLVSNSSSNGSAVYDDAVNSLTICGTKLDGTARFGLELLPSDEGYVVEQSTHGTKVTLGETSITIPSTSTIEVGESYGTYVEFDGDVSGWIMAGTSPIYNSADSDEKLEQLLKSFIPDALEDYGMDVRYTWRSGKTFFAVAALPESMQTNAETYYAMAIRDNNIALLLVGSPGGGGALDVVNSVVIGKTYVTAYKPGAMEPAGSLVDSSKEDVSSGTEDGTTATFGSMSFKLTPDFEGEIGDGDFGTWMSDEQDLMVFALHVDDPGVNITSYTAPLLIDAAMKTVFEDTLGLTLYKSEDSEIIENMTNSGMRSYADVRLITSGSRGLAYAGVVQAPSGEVLIMCCVAPLGDNLVTSLGAILEIMDSISA